MTAPALSEAPPDQVNEVGGPNHWSLEHLKASLGELAVIGIKKTGLLGEEAILAAGFVVGTGQILGAHPIGEEPLPAYVLHHLPDYLNRNNALCVMFRTTMPFGSAITDFLRKVIAPNDTLDTAA